ncbi:MAG: lipid-A-disaccharide synthase, partial [Proteobacteria bacterium]|nr:lipid-A-disaccharide synthase [Pseudomonadota bacterium]
IPMKNQPKLKIFLIAGESSGDILGAKLIKAIKQEIPQKEIEFLGVGGIRMAEQNLHSIFPMSELSLMGFAEIIPHIPKLLNRIKQTANAIIEQKPDIVVTIDSPDFCFRVIKRLKKTAFGQKVKKVHFIAPSVWAYRPKRAQKVAQLFDLLLAILPFEPPYFEKHGLKTVFIGHPITENEELENKQESVDFRQKYEIDPDKILLCLTPGSREGEVKRILPEMIKAANILARKHPDLVVAIPAVKKTHAFIKEHLTAFEMKVVLVGEEEKSSIFKASNVAIAKSGTNTLELAMAKLPMIVTYKANILTYLLVKMMAKIKFANLINLIFNQELIPELLQFDCKGEKMAQKIEELMQDAVQRKTQIDESQTALKMLGMDAKEKPSQKAAKAVLSLLV